jgi:oligoribonuclease
MHYLWLDLETTGLDPASDDILEVGLVVTDEHLTELAERRYLLDPGYDWQELVDQFVLEMHTKSGLLAELTDPYSHFIYHSLLLVERCIVNVIEPYLTDGKIVLAGSGVATFDLQVIKAQMPELAQRLTYWTMDIGVVRRYLRDICQVELPDTGPVNHRALDDVHHHLDEAILFRDLRARPKPSTLVDL